MSLILLLLVLIGGVVALPFVLLARRRPSPQRTSAAEVVTYLIMSVATLITINSVSSLLELVMPGDGVLISGSDDLALSLSTLIVAGVVAAALWIVSERNTTDKPRAARELYLGVVIAVSMGVVAAGSVRLLLWAVGADELAPAALADVIVFGAGWLLHERLRRRPEELGELRQVAGSLIGLSLSIGGSFAILNSSLEAIVGPGQVIVGDQSLWDTIRVGLVLLVVGAPFFWWFWLRGLATRSGSWRGGYATLVSILAWISGLTALTVIVNQLVQWVVGLAAESAARHFDSLPFSASTVIVAAITYWHHRAILGRERNLPIRIAEYIFAALGLIAGSTSLVVLLAILGENLFGGSTVLDDSARVALGALVVLVVAAVVVWRYWVKALRLSSDPVERTSAPRKVTLLLLRIGFFFTGAGALIAVLFFLLRAALDGDATGLGEELSWSVPLVLVSAAMVWHLWEQRVKEPEEMAGPLAPVPGSVRPRMVTVVAFDPGPLPSMIQGMRFLRRSDGIGTVDQARAEEIVSVLDGVASTSALVTVGEGGFEVVPIQ